MTVHLYTFCWNEAFIIPFFLRHWLPEVDKIIVFDNESNDGSLELLTHEKIHIESDSGQASALVQTGLRNNIWKNSRGQADWVIVVDMDEFLYYPGGLRNFLMAEAHETSLLYAVGYDMISETLPDPHLSILDQVRRGARNLIWDKPCAFRPDAIQEINFHHGAHGADPTGDVRIGRFPGFKMLHYKYLSYDYFSTRTKQRFDRVVPAEKEQGLNVHYLTDEQELRNQFNLLLSQTQEVF